MNALRYALRQLRRRPVFSGLVIAMLGLGIGATTAMFSLFHQVLLRELPVPQPEEIVNLGAPGPKPGNTSCTSPGDCSQVFSYPMFRDLAARQTVFSEIAGHRPFSVNLSYHDQTQTGQGLLASGGYFPALRVQAFLGRMLGPQDEPQVGESAVAVLSYDYWQSSLGSDPGVIGQTLMVNGQALTIVGVAPEGFAGTTFGSKPRVFVPLTLRWLMEPTVPKNADDRVFYWVYLFARLKPGVSAQAARAGINTLYSGILNEVEVPLNSALTPETLPAFRARQITLEPGARGQSQATGFAGPPLTMLFGISVVVLLIVCVNVANLMLARGAGRAAEMAIRSSIGANRLQLVRDLLLESSVLAILGGVLSIPVAAATLQSVYAIMPAEIAESVTLSLSPAAAGFAGAMSLASVLLFGLLPALRATRTELGAAMKGQARHALGNRALARFSSWLATAQIVFSMLLLVFAGLFARSLANLANVDLGMDVDSLVTFDISPQRNGYSSAQSANLYDRLERDLAAVPGVTQVASALVPVVAFNNWNSGIQVDGYDAGPTADHNASMNQVSPGFFRALSIPLLAGRDFTDADTLETTRVAIVNQTFLRKFHLENDALGKRISMDGLGQPMEIVGVVADAKYSTVKDPPPAQFILPRRQNGSIGGLAFYVRASVSSDEVMTAVRRVVAEADPNLPVSGLLTMPKVVEANLFTERLIAILSSGFALLATFLAAMGLYGVLAYNVAQRTRELGLRLALGATPPGLRAMVLKQVAKMALVGMPIGLAAGVGLGQAAHALLFGLAGYDPVVLGTAVAVLAAVVLAAGYFPARRASAVAPMEALRYE
jgi:predicted permease